MKIKISQIQLIQHYKVIRNTLICFLFLLAILYAYFLSQSYEIRTKVNLERVSQQTKNIKNDLAEFMIPAEKSLVMLSSWIQNNTININEPEKINRLLTPLLSQLKRAESFSIHNNDGVGYALIKSDATQLRNIYLKKNELKENTLNGKGDVLNSLISEHKNHPFQDPISELQTEPKMVQFHKLATTGVMGVSWQYNIEVGDSQKIRYSLRINYSLSMLGDLLKSLSEGAKDNSLLFSLDSQNNIVSLNMPRTMESDLKIAHKLGVTVNEVLLALIKQESSKYNDKPFQVILNNAKWNVNILPIEDGVDKRRIGIAIKKGPLLYQDSNGYIYILLWIFTIGLFIATSLIAWLMLFYNRHIKRIEDYHGHVNDSEKTLKRLISKGENDYLEFKSTLRWNLKSDKPGKEIETAVLKSITAFMNSNGGTLFVGVEDDGSILGIEPDNFSNADKYLLHFNNMLNQKIGLEFTKNLAYALKVVENKQILLVDCLKSEDPIFVRENQTEDFYIRVGNGTRKLATSQVLEYIKKR